MTLGMLQQHHHHSSEAGANPARMDINQVLSMMYDLKQENVELRREIASLKQNVAIDSCGLAEQIAAKMSDQVVKKIHEEVHLKLAVTTEDLVTRVDAIFDSMLKHWEAAGKEAIRQSGSYTPL